MVSSTSWTHVLLSQMVTDPVSFQDPSERVPVHANDALVPTPDTASAFLAYPSLHSLVQATPSTIPAYDGTIYQQVFRDLNGATSAKSYLGLYTLQPYSTKECAAHSDQTDLCTAFNIFAEHDPALRPSTNDTAPTVWGNYCSNPPSMTSFKCTLWGAIIDSSTATDTGQPREQFEIVVTARLDIGC